MVYDGTLLESVEGLGEPPLVTVSGEVWHRLQDEKIALAQSLLAEDALLRDGVPTRPDTNVSEEVPRELEWMRRAQLESRLRAINEAQDRLIEGMYGQCIDCAEEIDSRRLATNPAAARCFSCQSMTDGELRCPSM
jgi:RNA polymerase-binding transcription factor